MKYQCGTLVSVKMEDGYISAIYLDKEGDKHLVLFDDGSDEGFIFAVDNWRVEK